MRPMIENCEVYGLEQSVKASKYPFAVNPDKCTSEITERTMALGEAPRGSGHDNFLKGIVVQFDLTCTNKMWVEAERYHFFDIISSQSSVHRIAKFNLEEQMFPYVDKDILSVLRRIIGNYALDPTDENYLKVLYNVPSGLMLTARITTNYQQLKTIYYQRKDHRLPEWRIFCNWITTLPEFKKLCLGIKEEENNDEK